MNDTGKTHPTWGYHATEPARIFDLKDGEDLPNGWEDTPAAFSKAKEESKELDPAKLDAVKAKGAKAKEDSKERSVPPAYRGKPEEAAWLAGYDEASA